MLSPKTNSECMNHSDKTEERWRSLCVSIMFVASTKVKLQQRWMSITSVCCWPLFPVDIDYLQLSNHMRFSCLGSWITNLLPPGQWFVPPIQMIDCSWLDNTTCGPYFGTKSEGALFSICFTDWNDSICKKRQNTRLLFSCRTNRHPVACTKLFTRTDKSNKDIWCPIGFML